MHGLGNLPANIIYDLYVNGMDVLSININTCDVRRVHEFSVIGMKRLSIIVHPCDVREYVDVISESGIPGMNGLGPELALNGLNDLN